MPWTEERITFVNPYNFVPLGGKVERETLALPVENYTGKISCQMTLKTPMALPDHEQGKASPEIAAHYCYPFMQINGLPVIPGSEIRGSVRSVFEAATNSCLGILDEKPLHARFRGRILDRRPGLLHFNESSGKWELFGAEAFLLNTMTPSGSSLATYRTFVEPGGEKYVEINKKRYHNGDKVSFSEGPEYRTSKGFNTGCYYAENIDQAGADRTGYLLIGELGLTGNRRHRHNSHIFALKVGSRGTVVDEKDVSLLKSVLECYQDEKVNGALRAKDGDHSGYAGFEIKKGKDVFLPVWYQQVGNHYVFSTAQQGREAYMNTLQDLAGDHSPCKTDLFCPACRLFGMVGSGEAVGGRVRFSDAVYCGTSAEADAHMKKRVVLKELASPKVSAYEFYLKRPGADARVWTPDYKIIKVNRQTRYISVLPEIRGRKFYFHHSGLKDADYTTKERTERNCTVDLLKEGTFRFEVFFNRVSEEELQQLMWSLSPTDGGKDLCLKMGFGKPLGLGSVKISIEKVQIREWDGEQYQVRTYNEPVVKPRHCPAELLKILDFNCIPASQQICYPLGEVEGRNDPTSKGPHQWFAGNRAMLDGATSTDPDSNFVLPELKDRSLTLPKLVDERVEQNNRYGRYR